MAAKFRQSAFLHLFILLFISTNIPLSSTQLHSPQNIQTFYPFSPPPSRHVNNPPEFHPPPPPTKSSTRAAVGKAIGVTAATTLVLSGLIFFLLVRYSRGKRDADVAATKNMANSLISPNDNNDNFVRFNGNVEGVIVDENGLDVLYWKNLEDGENRGSFKKEFLKEEQNEEQKRMNSNRVQEVPLLGENSSTSQSPVFEEKEDEDSSLQILKNQQQPPSLASSAAVSEGKMPAPPPPPPLPTPSPLLAIRAVQKEEMVASPPPPSLTNVGASALPLKPSVPNGMGSKGSSSVGEGASGNGNGQVKLKPLHWDKVNPNVQHSMVWDKIDNGSFKVDDDLMEALFGYVATNRRSSQRDNNTSASEHSHKPTPPSKIFILDPRKSQNTAIVLKSLSVSHKDIIDALEEGQGLNTDTIEKLTRIAPTDEESSEILAYNGDPDRLSDAESFLYHLLKAVPSAFTRFKALLFRSNYDLEVSHLKESLQSFESACKELRTRGPFLKLLEAVLKAGNRLNAGTARGNAQAFNLTALRKLSDVKSSDGKTTLLQFVVQEVIRAEGKRRVVNKISSLSSQSSSDSTVSEDDAEREYMVLGLQVIGGLSTEFSNVKKAAVIDYDHLVRTSSVLSGQVVEIQRIVEQCGSDGGFGRDMKGFLDTAELEMELLKEEENRVMELVKKTTDYYQAGMSKDKVGNSLQLFVIVRDFLGMVDEVCVEIARNVQKKKPGIGSSSSESPRVFKFPKLPDSFMSGNSKSSSDESDSD